MTFRNLLLANAMVSVFTSLALLLLPASILDLFSMPSNAATRALLQFFGAQLLGTGLITLFAMNTRELRSQRSITLSFFISNGIGFIVSLGAMLSGAMNVLGWFVALVFLALTLGFGYFQFIGPAS